MKIGTGERNLGDLLDGGHQATVQIGDAYADDVLEVLSADPRAKDGHARSQWVWLRFPNGDLFLAIAPQDETYFGTEQGHTV